MKKWRIFDFIQGKIIIDTHNNSAKDIDDFLDYCLGRDIASERIDNMGSYFVGWTLIKMNTDKKSFIEIKENSDNLPVVNLKNILNPTNAEEFLYLAFKEKWDERQLISDKAIEQFRSEAEALRKDRDYWMEKCFELRDKLKNP